MSEKLKISFPVCEVSKYALGIRGKCIMLQMAEIAPVGSAQPPTMCQIVGMLENGKICQFVMPIHEWKYYLDHPTMFIEVRDEVAPVGALLDKAGKTLKGV